MTTLGFGSRNSRISISNLATIGCIFPQMSQVEFQGKLSFKSNWLKRMSYQIHSFSTDTTKHQQIEQLGAKDQQECVYNCGECGFSRDPTKWLHIGSVDRDNLSGFFHTLLSSLY